MGFPLVHIPPSKQFTDTIQVKLESQMERNNNTKKCILISANTIRGLKTKHISLGEKGQGSRHHTNVEISIFFSHRKKQKYENKPSLPVPF